MKKHTKIYFKFFNIAPGEFIPCEVCEAPAVDIHHIKARGMGGRDSADTIENLMAVCRQCHTEYGDKTEHREYLIQCHKKRMDERK